MNPQDVLALRLVEEPRFSRDGRIAYGVRQASLEKKTYFAHIHIDGKPVTSGEVSDTQPRWARDGRLAFVRTVEKAAQIWVGEKPLTSLPKGRISGLAWSPDGSRLAFAYTRTVEGDVVVRRITTLRYREEGRGWLDSRSQICVADARTGEVTFLTEGPFDHAGPTWSPDGRFVAFAANRHEDADYRFLEEDLWVVPVEGGPLRRLAKPAGPVHTPSWSPDGKYIAYLGHDDPNASWGTRNTHLWVVPLDGGEARDLVRDLDRPCEDATITDSRPFHSLTQAPVWHGGAIYFTYSDRGATRLARVTLDGRREDVTEGPEVVQQFDVAPDGAIAMTVATPGDVGELYVQRGRERTRVTALNADLLRGLPAPQEFQVGDIHAWMLMPPGKRNVPMVLQIHGGPRAQYGHILFHEFQMLAAIGYAVLYSNPRGSQGYGESWTRAIVNGWGDLDYKDIMAVVDEAVKAFPVDASRMAVMGGSYGGYMTNWIVGHTDRFKCAMTERCVSNLYSMAGTSDFGYEDWREFGGHAFENAEGYAKQSPVTYIRNIRTPLLIIHSEGDLRCPIEQAEQVYAFLKAQKREVEFLRFPEENHDLSRGGRPDRRVERLKHIAGWLKKHLG